MIISCLLSNSFPAPSTISLSAANQRATRRRSQSIPSHGRVHSSCCCQRQNQTKQTTSIKVRREEHPSPCLRCAQCPNGNGYHRQGQETDSLERFTRRTHPQAGRILQRTGCSLPSQEIRTQTNPNAIGTTPKTQKRTFQKTS